MDLQQKLSTALDAHPGDFQGGGGGASSTSSSQGRGGGGGGGGGGNGGGKMPRAAFGGHQRNAPFQRRGRGGGGRGGRGGRGGHGGGGRGGYRHSRGRGGTIPAQPRVSMYGQKTVEDIAVAPREDRVLKVSCKSNVKSVAGSIAYVCRAGEAPILYATGYDPCNQAVKSICVAGKYLESDGFELRVVPVFQGDTASVHLRLEKRDRSEVAIDPATVSNMVVLKSSNPFKSAGAIASRVRLGERVAVLSNGQGVFRALEAVAVAKQYLQQDAKDISFEASMVNIVSKGPDGRESTSVKIRMLLFATDL